jgi:hypothetical protein
MLTGKDYLICGRELGMENEGKVALIHRALYGGKSSGRDFRNHLRSRSCPADPDVWMRSASKSDETMKQRYLNMFFYTPMTPSLLELKLSQS